MPRIIVRPALATLLIHGLLLLSLTLNWGVQDREVVKAKPAPTVINARLVDASEFKPKPKPKPVTKKPQPKPTPKPVVKKPVEDNQAEAKARGGKKAKGGSQAKTGTHGSARSPSQHRVLPAKNWHASPERSWPRPLPLSRRVPRGEMSATFAALIQQTVINYWSRPPSARNGMEAELAIQLIPTGEVVSVQSCAAVATVRLTARR